MSTKNKAVTLEVEEKADDLDEEQEGKIQTICCQTFLVSF
jgi:hypothetical protein